jgi:hypothetical protein
MQQLAGPYTGLHHSAAYYGSTTHAKPMHGVSKACGLTLLNVQLNIQEPSGLLYKQRMSLGQDPGALVQSLTILHLSQRPTPGTAEPPDGRCMVRQHQPGRMGQPYFNCHPRHSPEAATTHTNHLPESITTINQAIQTPCMYSTTSIQARPHPEAAA